MEITRKLYIHNLKDMARLPLQCVRQVCAELRLPVCAQCSQPRELMERRRATEHLRALFGKHGAVERVWTHDVEAYAFVTYKVRAHAHVLLNLLTERCSQRSKPCHSGPSLSTDMARS